MRPPAEQVIRDYLSRLSVAARNQLPPEDRSAFLARTRDYIERQSGVRDMTDPADVMRALSDYGEPEALVERERARLEVRRSERQRAAAATKASFWKPKPRGGGPHRDGKDGDGPVPPYGHLTRKGGRPAGGETKPASRPSSSRRRSGAPVKPPKTRRGRVPPPAPAGSRPEQNGAAGSGPAQPGRTGTPAGPGGTGPSPEESRPVPSQVTLNGVVVGPGSGTGAGSRADPGAAAAAGDGIPAAGTPAPPAPARRLQFPPLPWKPRRLQPGDITRAREAARRAADTGRQHRAEAIAVALLALGGLIIPYPIWVVGLLLWLIGAVIVVLSSQWTLGAKWLGVVGPLALVIIGTATFVSLGGAQPSASSYGHEVLADAMWLFKIGAVLGAAYLAWRLVRGESSAQIPPWAGRHHP